MVATSRWMRSVVSESGKQPGNRLGTEHSRTSRLSPADGQLGSEVAARSHAGRKLKKASQTAFQS